MTYNDIKASVMLRLSLVNDDLVDNPGFTNQMSNLMKECLSIVATSTRPNIMDYVIYKKPYYIIKKIDSLYTYKNGEDNYYETSSNDFNLITFDVSPGANVNLLVQDTYYNEITEEMDDSETITILNNDYENTLSYFENYEVYVSKEYTEKEGFGRSRVITITLTSSSDVLNTVRNFIVYNTDISDEDSYVEYVMPRDFISHNFLDNTYTDLENVRYVIGKLEFRGKNQILLKNDGIYHIYYNANYPEININTPDDEIEIEEQILLLLPIYISSQMLSNDDIQRSVILRNEFEMGLSRLDTKVATTIGKYYNSWDEEEGEE